MKKLSSQIATTKDQTDRLRKWGLKLETADICRIYTDEYRNNIPEKCVSINPEGELIYVDNMDCYCLTCDLLPRESHLYDHSYKDEYWILMIQWLIKNRHFSKEYLA